MRMCIRACVRACVRSHRGSRWGWFRGRFKCQFQRWPIMPRVSLCSWHLCVSLKVWWTLMAEVFELLSEQRGERRGQVIRYCLAGYNINLLTSSNKYRANLKNNNKTTRFRARSIVYSFGNNNFFENLFWIFFFFPHHHHQDCIFDNTLESEFQFEFSDFYKYSRYIYI